MSASRCRNCACKIKLFPEFSVHLKFVSEIDAVKQYHIVRTTHNKSRWTELLKCFEFIKGKLQYRVSKATSYDLAHLSQKSITSFRFSTQYWKPFSCLYLSRFVLIYFQFCQSLVMVDIRPRFGNSVSNLTSVTALIVATWFLITAGSAGMLTLLFSIIRVCRMA